MLFCHNKHSFFIYLCLLFLLRNLLTFSLFCNTSQSGQYFLRVDLCLNSLVHRLQFKLRSAISSLVVPGFIRFQTVSQGLPWFLTVSNGFKRFHVVSRGFTRATVVSCAHHEIKMKRKRMPLPIKIQLLTSKTTLNLIYLLFRF
jgi:hypothetical protein